MLIKLTPDQVSQYWPLIEKGITTSSSPDIVFSEEGLVKMLHAALAGKIQCWVMFEKDDKPCAIGTTIIQVDTITGARTLQITSLYGIVNLVSDDAWKSAFASLKLYAVRERCSKVMAFTDVQRVVDIAEKIGGNTKTVVLTWEIANG